MASVIEQACDVRAPRTPDAGAALLRDRRSSLSLGCTVSMVTEAAELSVATRLALVTAAEVVSWADRWILMEDEPCEPLLDLCTMENAHPQDVIRVLDSLAGHYRVVDQIPRALRRAPELLEAGIPFGRTLAKAMFQLYVDEGYDVPEELGQMSWFDDAFDLAREGLTGTEEEVLCELRAFVASVASGPR